MRALFLPLALLALSLPAGAFPTDGATPALNEAAYLSFPSPKESIGDLTFYGKADKPAFKTLTTTERLMVGGGQVTPGQEHLRPYYQYVFDWAAAYYEATGTVPSTLDPDTIKKLPNIAKLSPAMQEKLGLEMLRNPLSGNWPRLDAKTASPGDFYIRPISTSELQHLATFNPDNAKLWFQSLASDGKGNLTQPAKLGCVLYVRMYGLKGPLMATYMTSSWS